MALGDPMATVATYDEVLALVQQLSPEDQARLLMEVERVGAHARRARAEAALDGLDQLAERVSAAWQDNMSAVDAVREQRREL